MLSIPADALSLPAASFEVVIEEHNHETVVRCFGEIDLAGGPSLTAILHRVTRSDAPVRLDLSGVEFFDTSGLHALETAQALADRLGRRLEVGPVSEAVTRMTRLAGRDLAGAR